MESGSFAIFTQMAILFVVIGAGYICKKCHLTTHEVDRGLSAVTLNVAMPALILSSVLTAEQLPSAVEIAITFFAGLAVHVFLLALAFGITTLLRVPADHKGAYRFMLVFGNVGFLGFPVIAAIFGADALIYASIFNLPFNLLAYTAGPWLITQDKADAEPEKVTIKTFTNPMMIVCLVAILLVILGVKNIPVITDIFTLAGNMATPAAMIVIGSQLADIPVHEVLGTPKIWIVSIFRLIICPLLVWLVFSPFIENSVILGSIVIISAMPVANVGVMFSLFYGVETKTLSQGIFISTVLSLITIPLLVMIML